MALRKKRGGEFREVDDQIIRWRKRLQKEGIAIGHCTGTLRTRAREKWRAKREAAKAEAAANPQKKNWFGG